MKKGDIIKIDLERYLVLRVDGHLVDLLSEDNLLSKDPIRVLEHINKLEVVGNVIECYKVLGNILTSKVFVWLLHNYNKDTNRHIPLEYVISSAESELQHIGYFNEDELSMLASLVECIFTGVETKLADIIQNYQQLKNILL